jgi:hypothetical protein
LNLVWLEALRRGVVDGVIAITKAPQNLLGRTLPEQVVVHCTVTGHGGSDIEPGVQPPEVTLVAYHDLVDRYGSERIVLRIDPILACDEAMVGRAEEVAQQAEGRVRISFMDFYYHARQRFLREGIEYDQPDFHAPQSLRRKLWDRFDALVPRGEVLEVCAEPGLVCPGCVSERDVAARGLEGLSGEVGKQRKHCCCVAEKKELLASRERCAHECLYCYWKD